MEHTHTEFQRNTHLSGCTLFVQMELKLSSVLSRENDLEPQQAVKQVTRLTVQT